MERLSEKDLRHPTREDIAFYLQLFGNYSKSDVDIMRWRFAGSYERHFGVGKLPRGLKKFLDINYTEEISYDRGFWDDIGLPYERADTGLVEVRDAIRLFYLEQLENFERRSVQ